MAFRDTVARGASLAFALAWSTCGGGVARVAFADPAPSAVPTFAPATIASPGVPAATPPPKLSGEMARYSWFPGRWACRTAMQASNPQDPRPAKLWVQVDGAHNALREEFSMPVASGKAYRSDDTLSYDGTLKAYVRNSIDMNGTQVVLAAKAPYAATMNFAGFVTAKGSKLYRMRAIVGIDAAGEQMTTATAFFHPDTKTWVVQSTVACSKISN